MNVVLANRIVAGATAGRLVLTLHEATELLGYLAEQPHAAVHVTDPVPHLVAIAALPVTVLDPGEHPDMNFLTHLDEPERSHLSSWAEGLLEVDDVRRLLRWT